MYRHAQTHTYKHIYMSRATLRKAQGLLFHQQYSVDQMWWCIPAIPSTCEVKTEDWEIQIHPHLLKNMRPAWDPCDPAKHIQNAFLSKKNNFHIRKIPKAVLETKKAWP